MAWLVPSSDRVSRKRINGRVLDIEVILSQGLFDHHLTGSMAKKLVKDNPPIIRGKLVLLEFLGFRSINEGILLSLALSDHAVGNDHVLEASILPDVVVLMSSRSARP